MKLASALSVVTRRPKRFLSHLSDRGPTELAPSPAALLAWLSGCRGFIGPFPPPLSMRAVMSWPGRIARARLDCTCRALAFFPRRLGGRPVKPPPVATVLRAGVPDVGKRDRRLHRRQDAGAIGIDRHGRGLQRRAHGVEAGRAGRPVRERPVS